MSIEERAAAGITGEFNLTRIPCSAAASVEFKNGARTQWHTHPGIQTLVCVSGRGWVRYWDGASHELTPGVIHAIPEGAKHWHGAELGQDMTHVALNPAGQSTLLGPVSD
jgi:quercetin dioxygenase-like cupin family protein